MKRLLKNLWVKINLIRSLPAILAYKLSPSKDTINKDIKRWIELKLKESFNKTHSEYINYLMLYFPEFRNVFYYRIQKNNPILGRLIKPFYPKLKSLYISTENIGGGLVIHHGFSSIIYAKSIGENCTIAQQVTIGATTKGIPVIRDNVQITAGAVVIGDIEIGSNSIIGANATVSKNIPDNCVVVGNPAYIVRMNGEKIKRDLQNVYL